MLCQFAREFPPLVAKFLESDRLFRRRLGETTVTDLLMVNLQNLRSDRIIVDFPDEPTTGADMEWNFLNRTNRTFYRLLLQAKRAYGDDALLSRHTYRYLSHRSASGRYQADILCGAALKAPHPTYPLYIFYNPAHTCVVARHSAGPVVKGINLANAYAIRSFARSHSFRMELIRSELRDLQRWLIALGALRPRKTQLSSVTRRTHQPLRSSL
jgi:hypothetical protein